MTTRENENSLFYFKPEAHLGVSTLSPHAQPFIPYVNPHDKRIAQLRWAKRVELLNYVKTILAHIESDLYM